MHYLYTGEFHFGADTEGQELSIEYLFEFLRVADEYILEDVSSQRKSWYIDIGENPVREVPDGNIERR